MASQEKPPLSFNAGELNDFLRDDGLPAREDDRPVLVIAGRPRPWPRASREDLVAFAERQWRVYRGEE